MTDSPHAILPWLPVRVQRWVAPLLRVPPLHTWRIAAAYAVAIGTDAAQLALGAAGWAFIDEGLDLAAMIVLAWLLGFHPLLLPTFVIEFIPVADMLPTWTGCVALVINRRRKQRA